MNAKDLFDDAKKLCELLPISDARRRTIISRAYYAAYHFLKQHECTQHYQFDSSDGLGRHRHFIKFLGSSPERNVQYAAAKLVDLYSWRVKADYRLHEEVPRGQEVICVEDAEEIIEDILLEYDAKNDRQASR